MAAVATIDVLPHDEFSSKWVGIEELLEEEDTCLMVIEHYRNILATCEEEFGCCGGVHCTSLPVITRILRVLLCRLQWACNVLSGAAAWVAQFPAYSYPISKRNAVSDQAECNSDEENDYHDITEDVCSKERLCFTRVRSKEETARALVVVINSFWPSPFLELWEVLEEIVLLYSRAFLRCLRLLSSPVLESTKGDFYLTGMVPAIIHLTALLSDTIGPEDCGFSTQPVPTKNKLLNLPLFRGHSDRAENITHYCFSPPPFPTQSHSYSLSTQAKAMKANGNRCELPAEPSFFLLETHQIELLRCFVSTMQEEMHCYAALTFRIMLNYIPHEMDASANPPPEILLPPQQLFQEAHPEAGKKAFGANEASRSSSCLEFSRVTPGSKLCRFVTEPSGTTGESRRKVSEDLLNAVGYNVICFSSRIRTSQPEERNIVEQRTASLTAEKNFYLSMRVLTQHLLLECLDVMSHFPFGADQIAQHLLGQIIGSCMGAFKSHLEEVVIPNDMFQRPSSAIDLRAYALCTEFHYACVEASILTRCLRQTPERTLRLIAEEEQLQKDILTTLTAALSPYRQGHYLQTVATQRCAPHQKCKLQVAQEGMLTLVPGVEEAESEMLFLLLSLMRGCNNLSQALPRSDEFVIHHRGGQKCKPWDYRKTMRSLQSFSSATMSLLMEPSMTKSSQREQRTSHFSCLWLTLAEITILLQQTHFRKEEKIIVERKNDVILMYVHQLLHVVTEEFPTPNGAGEGSSGPRAVRTIPGEKIWRTAYTCLKKIAFYASAFLCPPTYIMGEKLSAFLGLQHTPEFHKEPPVQQYAPLIYGGNHCYGIDLLVKLWIGTVCAQTREELTECLFLAATKSTQARLLMLTAQILPPLVVMISNISASCIDDTTPLAIELIALLLDPYSLETQPETRLAEDSPVENGIPRNIESQPMRRHADYLLIDRGFVQKRGVEQFIELDGCNALLRGLSFSTFHSTAHRPAEERGAKLQHISGERVTLFTAITHCITTLARSIRSSELPKDVLSPAFGKIISMLNEKEGVLTSSGFLRTCNPTGPNKCAVQLIRNAHIFARIAIRFLADLLTIQPMSWEQLCPLQVIATDASQIGDLNIHCFVRLLVNIWTEEFVRRKSNKEPPKALRHEAPAQEGCCEKRSDEAIWDQSTFALSTLTPGPEDIFGTPASQLPRSSTIAAEKFDASLLASALSHDLLLCGYQIFRTLFARTHTPRNHKDGGITVQKRGSAELLSLPGHSPITKTHAQQGNALLVQHDKHIETVRAFEAMLLFESAHAAPMQEQYEKSVGEIFKYPSHLLIISISKFEAKLAATGVRPIVSDRRILRKAKAKFKRHMQSLDKLLRARAEKRTLAFKQEVCDILGIDRNKG